MAGAKTFFCVILLLVYVENVQAHVFNLYADTNEEIKDSITISLAPTEMVIHIESVYSGQIAPHIRFMADTNGDKQLRPEEIKTFFRKYAFALAQQLLELPPALNGKPLAIAVTSVIAPTIASDDFVAEAKITTIITMKGFNPVRGVNKLTIDPRLFFEIGNLYIDMAKERAAFTDQQENAIARFLQVKVTAGKRMQFESSYPGYIDAQKKTMFGVFYDQTAIRVQFLPYTQLKAEFRME